MRKSFMDSGWQIVKTEHNIMLVREYKEENMAGKNGKSKGSVDSVKEVGGGYAGMNKSFSPMDAANPKENGMQGRTSASPDYSQHIMPSGRRDNAGRTIRGKNPSTGK
jgi:hypothetical protein